jgi:hypothetical protein
MTTRFLNRVNAARRSRLIPKYRYVNKFPKSIRCVPLYTVQGISPTSETRQELRTRFDL